MEMHVGLDSHLCSQVSRTDVSGFIANKERSFLSGNHAYFFRNKYPIPSPVKDKSCSEDGFRTLYKDLILSAKDAGFELVQKGRVPDSQLSQCKNSTNDNAPFDGWDLICARYYTYSYRLGKKVLTTTRSLFTATALLVALLVVLSTNSHTEPPICMVIVPIPGAPKGSQ